MSQYVDVVLPLAAPGTYTYLLPEALSEKVGIGSRVTVAFGTKKVAVAVVLAVKDSYEGSAKLKAVLDVLDDAPLLLRSQLDFWNWLAHYYMCTPGEVMKAALPAKLKEDDSKGVPAKYAAKAERPAKTAQSKPAEAVQAEEPIRTEALSEAQTAAFEAIRHSFSNHDVCLLHGVTSSGKTEIYTHLMAETMAAGRQVLYLLPEIALTTQITNRLERIFPGRMGVYHSKFSDTKRLGLWQRQRSDEPYPLILGVRSSLFLPWQNLGLVIVDEEHDTSYKQQDPAPRYNARDAAIMLAKQFGAKVLLGTATPSVETYHKVQTGRYGYAALTTRYGDVSLPEVVVEDVKELQRKKMMHSPFSPRLTEAVRRALQNGEQAILFYNRRGYSPVLECRSCAWTPRCTACDVNLTFHQQTGKLVCHYCGASYGVPEQCPQCEERDFRDIGFGTEKIEAAVAACFPEARIARMDADTTKTRTAHEKIIAGFQKGETNLLVGTQMVTKGLDFDRVSVVGILNADQLISQPDFRAFEHGFQLMAQVAGRAGRRGKQGKVFLQTRQADLPLIRQVVDADYLGLYEEELEERRAFAYPPFVRLIAIYFKHREFAVVDAAAHQFAALIRPHFGDKVLGPDRPAVGRVSHLHIQKILLKVLPEYPISGVRRTLLAARENVLALDGLKNTNIFFDVDPY